MNILIINTAYTGGGAEKVTRQLRKIMLERGHNVHVLVGYNKDAVTEKNVTVLYGGMAMRAVNRLVTNNHSHASVTIPLTYQRIAAYIKKHKIDVVHLNNIHGNYLGINDVAKIQKLCPIVWTIHDFYSMTGHCAYTYGCDRWKNKCGNCPHLNTYPELRKDKTKALLQAKQSYCHQGIIFASPSQWLKDQMLDSILKDEDIRVVYNSLNEQEWIKYDKSLIRKKHGLSETKKIIAFVAASLSEPRKGIQHLLDCLANLEHPDQYQLIVAGSSVAPQLKELESTFDVRYFGYISDEKTMNEFFSAADYFINPSTDDIFGLVNIEALASGTPVVAFDVCAIKEIIDENSGIVVDRIDGEAMAKAIEISGEEMQTRLKDCFTESFMASEYEKIYKEAVDTWRKA